MLIAQRPTLTEETISEQRSRFIIEPLEPGFGYTLGNSLRRTLLSSIPGAAVTSIRIEGTLHEFTTVPGVKEDVTEIILNLKGLVVSSDSDEPVTMYLRKQGPGEVTAADIAPPAGVEVHNPELHIATLNGKGRLEIELVVERGRGYVPAPQNKQPGQEIGRIPVDSIYSPVLKVTYAVEATRVEQRTDFDRLVVDVETKPSIVPRDAIASAGSTLVELFGLLRELNIEAEGIEVGPSPAEAADIANFSMPIEDMDLTVRSYNCLKREGVHTVGELVTRSEADLLDIRNFGAKSIDEVKMKLAAMGLALKDSPPGFIPTSVESYDEGYETDAYHGTGEYAAGYDQAQYDEGSFQETEQLCRAGAGRAPPPRPPRPRGAPHWRHEQCSTTAVRTTAASRMQPAASARPPEEGPTCPPPQRAPVSAAPPRTSG
jgi:DNA-directed RNA polymerase subunit alpha